MDYREIEPASALRPVVRCFWELRGAAEGAGAVERIVPDGCTEIILNRGSAFRRFTGDEAHLQAKSLVVGQLEGPISIQSTGSIDLLGIRFEPQGLFRVLGVPMHELTGADLCLGQVDETLRRELEEAGASARDRVAAVQAALFRRVDGRWEHGLVRSAVELVEGGARSMAEVVRRLGVNRRTLERAFRLEVGLSPKGLARIRRVQRVLARLDEGGVVRSWAEVAGAHGYADQSHLIREFRQLVGTTPGRYQRERSELAAHFEMG